MLRSVLVGLIVGLLSFAASGWIAYSALWWYTGQDAIQRSGGTPGVVLGGVWCLGVGVISGAVIGVFTAQPRAQQPSLSGCAAFVSVV